VGGKKMKSRKQWVKYVVLGLMMVLFVTAAACHKKETAEGKNMDLFPVIEEEILDSQIYEMGENAYLKIEETASYRVAEYYADEKLTQRAVHELATGEIIGWRLDVETGEETVNTYHIDDFKVDKD
jgi:hypothetical protein